jgi:hypothetical protein
MKEVEIELLKDILKIGGIDDRDYNFTTLEDCEFKIDIGDFKKGEKVDYLYFYFSGRLVQYDEDGEVKKSAKLKIGEDKA